jgi:hypothetical protein
MLSVDVFHTYIPFPGVTNTGTVPAEVMKDNHALGGTLNPLSVPPERNMPPAVVVVGIVAVAVDTPTDI